MVPPLVVLAAAAVSSAAILLIWSIVGFRNQTRSLVATNLQRGEVTNLREIRLSRPTRERALEPLVTRLARWVRRLTPAGSLHGLERKLVLAGRPMSWPLERILAAKIILASIGIGLGLLRGAAGAGAGTTVLIALFAVLLYFTPDVLLTARAKERQREILYALPDSLDQMTICMEAGLGFEAAMARASQSNDGPLAQEIVHTLQEIQVGLGRRGALKALADRNDVPDLRHFITAVLQAEGFGVPIAQVLRDQASDLRTKRRQRAEEAARKLPLKLLFPLVAFILPPLFIILVGPAALRLIEAFSQVG